jgi:hypothetical protein
MKYIVIKLKNLPRTSYLDKNNLVLLCALVELDVILSKN